jgi:hypothetical protein
MLVLLYAPASRIHAAIHARCTQLQQLKQHLACDTQVDSGAGCVVPGVDGRMCSMLTYLTIILDSNILWLHSGSMSQLTSCS